MLRELTITSSKNTLEYRRHYNGFSNYFLVVLAVAALLIATVAIYFIVYKRNINKALATNANTHNPMTLPFKVAIVLTIAVLIVGLSISCFVGYKVAYYKYEESLSQTLTFDIQTFYAEVKEVSDNTVLVEGISLNDENYQGEFKYNITEGTKLERGNTSIDITDFDEGDLVSVILVTDSSGFTDIFKIRLLDDLK